MCSRYDLSSTLLHGEASARDQVVYIDENAEQEEGIHALRHNQYKAHFITEGAIFSQNEDLECSQEKEVRPYSLHIY